VVDAAHDAPRLAFLLRDLPAQVLARIRSDHVLRRTVPPRKPGTRGHPPRHGGAFMVGDPTTPNAATATTTHLYDTTTTRAQDRLHPRLTHRSAWPPSSAPCR
jgi:hypothetical protein